jgi:hypothetical protein
MILRDIQNQEEFDCFNDLMVINRIVPKLPTECLREMIRLLKPIIDESLTTPQPPINLTPLFQLLATSPVRDPLLTDFLTCSGFTQCQA